MYHIYISVYFFIVKTVNFGLVWFNLMVYLESGGVDTTFRYNRKCHKLKKSVQIIIKDVKTVWDIQII